MSRITFDRSLYSPEGVEAAVAAFVDHADITLEREGDAVVAVVGDVKGHDRALIENAFSTFALQETIVRLRRGDAPAEEG
jgi:hypothetical protein